MSMYRSTLRIFSIAIPLLAAGAPALMAQNRTLFTWTGRVDREVQITMRGRDVWTNGVDRDDSRGRINVESWLPRTDGYVRVQALDGRGDVSVVQQPSSSNGYTTIVRVRDRSSGSDRYRLAAYWDSRYSDNRGGYGNGNGGYGNGNGGYGRDNGGYGRDNGGYGRNNGGYGRDNGGYGRGNGRDGRDGRDNGGYGRGTENVPSRIDPRDRSNGGWNGSTALRWSGNVDGEIEIRLQGRQMDERVLSGGAIRDERSSVPSDLSQRDGQLVISQHSGRGTVYVAQQPSRYNGYMAVIRVRDPQGGYGYYDFEADYR